MIPQEFVDPLIGSNVFALALLLGALKWPRAIRMIFVVLFGGAAIYNVTRVFLDPVSYVEGFGAFAIPLYQDFIYGFFSRHTRAIVLMIAAGQAVIALLLTGAGKRRRLGVIGATIFLLAIAPLGIGSAFPMSLLMIGALFVMHSRLGRMKE